MSPEIIAAKIENNNKLLYGGSHPDLKEAAAALYRVRDIQEQLNNVQAALLRIDAAIAALVASDDLALSDGAQTTRDAICEDMEIAEYALRTAIEKVAK